MQSQEERREQRVPLEQVQIELLHSGVEHSIDADGIDVGLGGIAMRSSVLPDIGAKVRCAFSSPVDGSTVFAEGQIVWAHHRGPHMGEFGVSFDDLEPQSVASLHQIIETHDRAMTHEEAMELGWVSSSQAVEPEWTSSQEQKEQELEEKFDSQELPYEATVSMMIDGVASEMVGDVIKQTDEMLIAEQSLPFLRLGTGITLEDGRRGVLENISLRIENDIPRLILSVELEREGVELWKNSELDTIPDQVLAAEIEINETAEVRSVAAEMPKITTETPQKKYSPINNDVENRQGWRGYLAVVSRFISTMMWPFLIRVSKKCVHLSVQAYHYVIPALTKMTRAMASRTKYFIAALREPKSENTTQTVHRRVQQRKNLNQAPSLPVESNPIQLRKMKNRIIFAITLIIVSLAAYKIFANQESEPEVLREDPAQVEATKDTFNPTSQPAAQIIDQPVENPSSAVSLGYPPSEMDTSISIPTPPSSNPMVAGPMPVPTYPVMGGDDTTTVHSVTTATHSMSFGAATVPNGQIFLLQMSTPIEAVEGQETESGFRVRLVHANSLSRAGPIAASHSRVDRAAITNQGENAELRIDFLPGRKPPYRIEARGRELRVIIGR